MVRNLFLREWGRGAVVEWDAWGVPRINCKSRLLLWSRGSVGGQQFKVILGPIADWWCWRPLRLIRRRDMERPDQGHRDPWMEFYLIKR